MIGGVPMAHPYISTVYYAPATYVTALEREWTVGF
jgi:hypothetical protein